MLMLYPFELAIFGVTSVIGVLTTVFWIWMLVDCATQEANKEERVIWVVVIALTHFIGALIYFFVRRSKRTSSAA